MTNRVMDKVIPLVATLAIIALVSIAAIQITNVLTKGIVIQRHIDCEAQTVCYFTGSGVSCMPLNQTALEYADVCGAQP